MKDVRKLRVRKRIGKLSRRLARRTKNLGRTLSRRPTTYHRRGIPVRVLLRQIRPATHQRKVDFVVAGVMRGGTSALFEYIRQHPEICSSALKEVHYFDNDATFRRTPNYKRYQAWFDPEPQHKVLGEATPAYMFQPEAPLRIKAYNPDIKIIMILRDPIERAYSHWNKHHAGNMPYSDFAREIEYQKQPIHSPDISNRRRAHERVNRGRYAEQIERIWSLFPKEHTLIIRNEDLRNKPDETMDRVFEFIGVSPFRCGPLKRERAIPYPQPMTKEHEDYLRSVFLPEVQALEKLLGWDCSDWLTMRGAGER